MQAADTLPQRQERRNELWETPDLSQSPPTHTHTETHLWVQILHGWTTVWSTEEMGVPLGHTTYENSQVWGFKLYYFHQPKTLKLK